jgi:hypothetical protein
MGRYYVAEAGGVVRPAGLMEWAEWFETSDTAAFADGGRVVARDELGDCSVLTVFLGLDRNHFGGEPILFETMVFGGEHDMLQRRYHTHAEALAGHAEFIALATDAAK